MTEASQSASEQEIKLYVKAPKVYPRETEGRFSRLRVLAAWVLLGLFYLLPWINLDGQQIVLFDLPARKFHVFGLVFWPQDFVMLALLLAIAAISLFFFTALAGRLWCGYACPQTVWTEVFLWMERFAEGPRNKRMRLDKAPWTAEKFRKKGLKQFLYITFSLWTGITFVGFFTPIRELVPALFTLQAGGWEVFWTFFYGFATYGNAGYLREQVCKYMCPYARFQSAMFDDDTLVISYDAERGEPRGKRKRDADKEELGLGDCIACQGCVQVCPTGIDIRDGLQIECIACAACIDVCDEVMDKMGYPRGLIRYSTENAMTGKRSRILRPRIFIYLGVLLALMTLFALILTGREMPSISTCCATERAVSHGRRRHREPVSAEDHQPHRATGAAFGTRFRHRGLARGFSRPGFRSAAGRGQQPGDDARRAPRRDRPRHARSGNSLVQRADRRAADANRNPVLRTAGGKMTNLRRFRIPASGFR